eukprot:sb/3477428/
MEVRWFEWFRIRAGSVRCCVGDGAASVPWQPGGCHRFFMAFLRERRGFLRYFPTPSSNPTCSKKSHTTRYSDPQKKCTLKSTLTKNLPSFYISACSCFISGFTFALSM